MKKKTTVAILSISVILFTVALRKAIRTRKSDALERKGWPRLDRP